AADHAAGGASGAAAAPMVAGRDRLLLDFGWRFHFGDANDYTRDFDFGSAGAGNYQKTGNFMPAASLAFDDSDWRSIQLPHDWAVELPYVNDPELQSKGFHPLGRKYPATSVGWYRRVFPLAADDAGKRITLEFDGVYRNAMVVFNGFYIGRHSGGYDPFRFDVTDFATPGQPNVLLVRVDATESDGWFYEGAGIYRHVWLVKTAPVHVRRWGTFVRSDVTPTGARLSILTEVENDGESATRPRILSTVLDPAGRVVAKEVSAPAALPAGEQISYNQQISVPDPKLWSLEVRHRYQLVTEVQIDGQTVDRYVTPFGIRSIRFDAERGFLLNGVPVKLRGTCNHQDHAGLGVALPDAVHRYRMRALQQMGCNALRTSHNPPTPELLDVCDDLGILVFDETRMMSSNPEGLQQFANLIRRDRNHPSVILWSMGNEEIQANTERGVRILSAMKAVAYRHDGSRMVSIAPTIAIGTGGLAVCDVVGYNYMDPGAEAFHKAHPERPVMGTENVSAVGTRGIYITDPAKGFVASYDVYTTSGRASAEGWWRFVAERPWLAGGFIWTGFDYRGEPSPNGWPNISSQYGVLDTCGFPKDSYYYYQAWWTDQPVLHLFPHWNWPGYEGKQIAVWVYSNLDQVELFHNGKSLGAKPVERNGHVAWTVTYAAGTLEARGWKGGRQVMATRRDTTGAAAKLVLRADRERLAADGEDVAMFAVEVQDASGRTMPITDNLVSFRVSGPATLLGTGNGDPTDQAPDKGSERKAFSGYCMALVQSTKQAGSITVEASSPGLTAATVTVQSEQAQLRPQVEVWSRSIPQGPGVTGLWRAGEPGAADIAARIFGAAQLFTLQQEGETLTGFMEGAGGMFGGGDQPTPISQGTIAGDHIHFVAGLNTFDGIVHSDSIELHRTVKIPFVRTTPKVMPNPPAIGPAPDDSDPSINFGGMAAAGTPLRLQRTKR
ncbi:MAG: DUF4982 domain-containing protein, partial [Acidobacteriota bacterium]|nr:DUF4982 domain-containing protein [Acidobacteriota bacterium]